MEEIAVLDGVDIPSYYQRRGKVIDASAGANYSGGSSWPGNLPLTPSNAGLAGLAAATQNAVDTGEDHIPISTIFFQQLLNMLGANIREDGVWGKSSADGFVRAVVASGGGNVTNANNVLPSIFPMAKGKTVLVPPKLMATLIKLVTRRMAGAAGGAMSGLADVDKDLVSYYAKTHVIDASGGGNYSGGSSWPGDLPLTPSNAGLADADLAQAARSSIPNYYTKKNVIDPSAGGNYSGGSAWDPSMPLTPSNAGLAGTYDGRSIHALDGHYGSSMEAVPGYYDAGRQIDPSAGGNYSGGSSWDPSVPLTPSNAGLAGLDAVPDVAFLKKLPSQVKGAFKRKASQGELVKVGRLMQIAKSRGRMDLVKQLQMHLGSIRKIRAAMAQQIAKAA